MEQVSWWQAILVFVIGTGVPFILAKFIPNSTLKSWGINLGQKLSTKARSFIGKDAWEKLENNILGGFVAFVEGVKEGADKDDAK